VPLKNRCSIHTSRDVASPGPERAKPPKNKFALLTKSGIKKEKIIKVELKRQSTDITHAFVAVCFRISK